MSWSYREWLFHSGSPDIRQILPLVGRSCLVPVSAFQELSCRRLLIAPQSQLSLWLSISNFVVELTALAAFQRTRGQSIEGPLRALGKLHIPSIDVPLPYVY